MIRTAIITGAYGAIGKAIARELARQGLRVFLIGRDSALLERTTHELSASTGNSQLIPVTLDLSSWRAVREFCLSWQGPLHLLVNNAATAPGVRTESPEGEEIQWAVNVLAYYRMIMFLNVFMEGGEDPRIVNVASYWAGGLDMDDPEFHRRSYDNDLAYRQAKQANRMMSAGLAEMFVKKGITVNSCHSGDVNSKLSNAFGFGGHETPEQGAATPLYLALSPEVQGVTGRYFEHRKPVACSFSRDRGVVTKLLELLESYPL